MELSTAQLKCIGEFSEVPDDQLQWLIDHSELKFLEVGDTIFSRGDPIDKMFIVLEGKAYIKINQNGNYKHLATIEAKNITGLLPYSRASSAIGIAEVVERSKVLITPKEQILELATKHYELTEALVHVMTNRTREFAKQNVQSEKMMALGKLSAGLAHELNNPVSAISRSALELQKQMHHTPEKV